MRQLKPKSLFGVSAIALCVIVGCITTAHAGWWRTFGGTETDRGYCVQQTSDSGYIVTGYTRSFGEPGVANLWLIKLDSFGHTEWTKIYGEGGGYSVRQTPDGGYIIAGWNLITKTDDNGDTIWTREFGGKGFCVQNTNDGNYIVSGRKSEALWLIKLNVNGDTLWERTYQKGNYEDKGEYVEQTMDGGYIVIGQIVEVDYEEMRQRRAIWLLKVDTNGDTLWTRTYGGENWDDTDRGNCVRQTSEGGYIIAGLLDDPANRWYCLIKTDSAGNIEWKGIEDGELHCVEQTPDGGYIAVGGTESGTYASSTSPIGGNLWLVKTDENGDTIWTREYGDGGTDAGRYVQQTSDSGYIVTGYTWSYGPGAEDLYLLKTDSLGLLSVFEKPTTECSIKWHLVSSVGQQIVLRYSNRSNGFRASILDVAGRKVDDLHGSGSSGTILWGKAHPSGVYFIRVEDENNINNIARVVIIR